jgi:hypothetical protein
VTPVPASGTAPAPAAEPPSLRRRGPARFDLTLRSGECPRIRRRRVHLRAGQTLVVQIVPQNAAAEVSLVPEHPLQTIVPVNRIKGNGAPTYYAEFTGHSPLHVIPLPSTSRLHVVLADGEPHPFKQSIPVTIWPSIRTLVLWWVSASLTILGFRWRASLADCNSVVDVANVVQRDISFVGLLVILGLLVLPILRGIGWVLAQGGGYDDEQ